MNPDNLSMPPTVEASALAEEPSAGVWQPGDPERRRQPENRRQHSDRVLALFRKFPGLKL